jgi:endonuclease/exonuclease/phosphatase family metal-dependent hydrolase
VRNVRYPRSPPRRAPAGLLPDLADGYGDHGGQFWGNLRPSVCGPTWPVRADFSRSRDDDQRGSTSRACRVSSGESLEGPDECMHEVAGTVYRSQLRHGRCFTRSLASAREEIMLVRVLSLNVWNTQGDPARASIINKELRRLKPDLISLQEVVQWGGVTMLERLLRDVGIQGYHQSDFQAVSPPFADKYGGTAIASRWPLQMLEVLDLRVDGAADVPWATLAAAIEIPDLGDLLFIGATTAWRPAAEAARERQAMLIADLDARHRRTLPTIIAGDFNASPEASSIRFLTGRQSLSGRSTLFHDAWQSSRP